MTVYVPAAQSATSSVVRSAFRMPVTTCLPDASNTAKGCAACHQFGSKLVGPDLVGVGDRRTPPWIARMIARPEIMIKDDPVARKLYGEMMTPMANQGVAEADLLPLIAYISHKGAP